MQKKYVEIVKSWKVYEIKVDLGEKFPVYVSKVYNGKIDYVTDYLYSKKYKSLTAARKIAYMISAEKRIPVI